ncbi:dihydroorotate dehydrogenase electron transfer subunit [Alienimonas californiensis]|uniref:Dihydroorotate dehydrogenase B (NAD(+)), electron transfer subunit n=1 Tax=Alienimonas californiensis TaxID=2527989 RepID=A0A517P9X0_9PLAN|nr:dihydroorotate dehydrogenase electron transfer subunit [Alienimonas californiensis]QDT16158.1 Dihydroorotate dehydrogenase B (NAD(+)), electron transfer subunit [Alienimonas californiensis]
MSGPAVMPHADAVQTAATVGLQERIARDTYALVLEQPDVADRIEPGQFLMLRLPGRDDPLLGRPFALYDVGSDRTSFSIGYLVVGKMTRLMTGLRAGDEVEVWGPLGNGFPRPPAPDAGPVLMVAGGIGQTPFLAAGREILGAVAYGERGRFAAPAHPPELLYGARSKEYVAETEQFESRGIPVSVATDDGSAGHHGFVTELLERRLTAEPRPSRVYTCGPEPMMKAVAKLCAAAGVPCWASLESPMACGFGACFSCVVKVRDADSTDGWDYRRSCLEGPVFPAEVLTFD